MKRALLLGLIFIATALAAKKSVVTKKVVVNLGSARVIELPFSPGDVLKGDSGEADVDPKTGEPGKPSDVVFEAKWKKNKVRIRGLKIGSGNLEIFDKRGRKRMVIWVYISSPNKGRIVASLSNLLKDVEGVKVYVSGNDIIIDGEYFRQKDRERINTIVKKFTTGSDGIKILNLTSYSPLFMQAMAKKIEKEINDPQIHIKPLKNKFLITGTISYTLKSNTKEHEAAKFAEAVKKAERYERIAKAFVGEKDKVGGAGETGSEIGTPEIVRAIAYVKKDETQVLDKLIRIQFDFVELSKSHVKKFGFNWSPGIFTQGGRADKREVGAIGDASHLNYSQSGGLTAVITGTINNLFPKLHNAKQFGHARILESGQVITKNKSRAHFKSGKMVLVPSTDKEGTVSYQQQQFGFNADIKPEIITSSNSVSLENHIIYNSLPPTVSIQAGQTIPSHEITNTLIIESGKSAAIGGMISNVSTKMHDRIPAGLEQSFFSIYHSKDFLQNKSQMVLFITPTIVESASSGSKELKRKFRMR